MRAYLVQHGEATAKEIDPERPLTEAGRRDVEKVAAFVRPLALRVGAIVHSGKTRAARTAEILSLAFQARSGVLSREGMDPNEPVGPLSQELAQAQEDLVLVGHLPFLSKLASALIAGAELREMIAFRQGGIVCVERREDATWRLVWVVAPELLV